MQLIILQFQCQLEAFHFTRQKDFDAALLQWFKLAKSNNIPINGPILLKKATSLARFLGNESFVATIGFIDRWKMRNGILMKLVSGEAGSVSEEDIRPWLDVTLPDLVSQCKWEDIYNVDETGVFYKL